MKKIMVTQVIPALLMLLFFYTALSKLMDHGRFEAALRQSPIIGGMAKIMSWGLPAAELVIAAMIFYPSTRVKGMSLSLFLLLLFTGYLFWMTVSDKELPCTCGGVISSMSWSMHMLFNLAFILLTAISITMYPRYWPRGNSGNNKG